MLRNHRAVITGVVTGVIVTVGAMSAYAFLRPAVDPIPQSIQRAATFSLYYPKDVPVDSHSMSLTNNGTLLTYTVQYQGATIYVSVQPRPHVFNIDTLSKQLSDPTQFLTAIGSAAVGELSNRRVGSVETSDSWIFVSSTLNTPSTTVASLLKQFTKA